MRIRIVQIDTPETFGPRCENELILGLKAKKRLRELLDSGTVPRKHHGGFSDEARDCDRDIDGIAGPVRGPTFNIENGVAFPAATAAIRR